MIRNHLFKRWTLQLFRPEMAIREKYRAFQSLLDNDKLAHELMAELEEILYQQVPVDFNRVEHKYNQFSAAVGKMITDLTGICPGKYAELQAVHKKFDDYVRYLLIPADASTKQPYTLALDDPQALDQSLVGGKAANLAGASQILKLPVPTGFAITTTAFHRFIAFNRLDRLIASNLGRLDIRSGKSLAEVSTRIGAAIQAAEVPEAVVAAVADAIADWRIRSAHTRRLAVRSSAVGEDSRTSFAGQYHSALNVTESEVVQAYKQVLASKYFPSALVYRINYGLRDQEVPMAVLVVEMIAAAASGIMVTGDPNESQEERLSIHTIWGLGQPLVDGQTVPAVYLVAKSAAPSIVSHHPHRQREQRVFDPEQGLVTRRLDPSRAASAPIDEANVLELARWGQRLENHFGRTQDVEWCLTDDDRLFLLQTRPFYNEASVPTTAELTCTFDAVDHAVLVSGGRTAAGGIAAGTTVAIEAPSDLTRIPDGSVAVTHGIPPAFAAAVNRLNAVVSEAGSTVGHFASVAREFGIPTIVNVPEALKTIPEGIDVTVNAENGTVYRGIVKPMIDSPCARRNLLTDSPFMNRLGAMMQFISALELVDPQGSNFTPHGCRSHHDIIRFVHEKAVAAMFQLSNIRLRRIGGSRKLKIGIPMLFYVIDLGGGLGGDFDERSELDLTHVASAPLRALFDGLTHPDIQWGSFSHFDWESHDKVVMSGGYISPDSVMFASHAIISATYANLNLRFGYHFVVLDAVCGPASADNYIMLRFSGGGADIDKRRLRAIFLSRVFKRLGFDVNRTSDLIDARYAADGQENTARTLDMVGRLLGATRLMDMYLKDEAMADAHAEAFMQGRYHFSNVELSS